MTQDTNLCEHTKIRLIAAAIGHQQCTQTDGTEVLIPGTAKRILVGDDAYLARMALPAAAVEQPTGDLTDEHAAFEKWARRTHGRPGTSFDRAHDGTYKDNRIAAKWSSWKARAATVAQPSRQPQGANAQPEPSRIVITLRQAQRLVAFFGGHDASVTVMPPAADWEQQMPGLYAYCTEYPEDGSEYLGPSEVDDDLARLGERAAIASHLARQSQPSMLGCAVPEGATNCTLFGGSTESNQVFVSMDSKPSTHLWTVGGRAYLCESAPVAQEAPVQAVPDLHNRIMNLPCNPPDGWGGIQQTGYKIGHRDARHAAAELASESEVAQEVTQQAAKAEQPLIGKLLDKMTQLQMLFPDGCQEPGALVRFSEVTKILVNAAKSLAPTTSTVSAPAEAGETKSSIVSDPEKVRAAIKAACQDGRIRDARRDLGEIDAHLAKSSAAPAVLIAAKRVRIFINGTERAELAFSASPDTSGTGSAA